MTEKEIIPKLIALLEDEEPMVRILAVGALGGMGRGGAQALPDLIKSFQTTRFKDPVMTVRYQKTIIWALGLFREEGAKAVPFLTDTFNNKALPDSLRCEAAEALGEIGRPAVSTIPTLQSALDQGNENLKEHIRNALDKLRQAQR